MLCIKSAYWRSRLCWLFCKCVISLNMLHGQPCLFCVLLLNTLDSIGHCLRPVFSLGVSQHICIKKNCEISSNGSWSCEVIMKEKTPLSHEAVCFQMLDFENSWKITSYSKTTLLQRELFLTMYYTINSAPLLVTK